MITIPAKNYTPEEYLELEIASETRHEYRNGEIIPMTGGTPTHNELVRAFTVILSLQLHKQPYQIFLADQRLWIPDRKIHTYPDVMVVAKPIELQPGRKDTVTQPIFIAEILSNSTKKRDRGEKFSDYRTISSFQEYLLVDQTKPFVEQYIKQADGQWLLMKYDRPEDKFISPSLGVEISLADLYENVDM
ncbi:MAG: Uma2 family endonuclease [Coleofasciculaceae cyanobacterium SM2_1_6]|nr:Uma2 family endonuclease [Coleofasciculaceae cyanobacterium SM2_1_6]